MDSEEENNTKNVEKRLAIVKIYLINWYNWLDVKFFASKLITDHERRHFNTEQSIETGFLMMISQGKRYFIKQYD